MVVVRCVRVGRGRPCPAGPCAPLRGPAVVVLVGVGCLVVGVRRGALSGGTGLVFFLHLGSARTSSSRTPTFYDFKHPFGFKQADTMSKALHARVRRGPLSDKSSAQFVEIHTPQALQSPFSRAVRHQFPSKPVDREL